jgi:hypothetical protein
VIHVASPPISVSDKFGEFPPLVAELAGGRGSSDSVTMKVHQCDDDCAASVEAIQTDAVKAIPVADRASSHGDIGRLDRLIDGWVASKPAPHRPLTEDGKLHFNLNVVLVIGGTCLTGICGSTMLS